MTELKQFVAQVHKMRLAQTRYFELIGRAKKSKLPADFATANGVLKISRQLEQQVDQAIELLSKQLTTNPLV
jgi:hypothetical protein